MWIKDLNIKADTLDLTEEKVGKSRKLTGRGKTFLNGTPMVHALKSAIVKWDHVKLKSFSNAKDTVNRTNRQATDWEKIITNPTSDRETGLLIHSQNLTQNSSCLKEPQGKNGEKTEGMCLQI